MRSRSAFSKCGLLTRKIAVLAAMIALTAATASAHPGHSVPGNGLQAGLTHPLAGWDHLLAMVTVGLLGSQLGGRMRWCLPAAFVLSMVGGGTAGINGLHLPALEHEIAATVLVLGFVVAMDRRIPVAIVIGFVCLAGLIHGLAHGAEMPRIDSSILYAIGFVLTTIALHAGGLLAGGLALKSNRGSVGLRLSGAAVALVGCWLLTSHF